MKATCKQILFTKRVKASGKYPVKIRIIFNREVKYYSVGIDLSKKEFETLLSSKKLKKQFDDVLYYIKKAEKIIDDLKEYFTWSEFERQFFNTSSANESAKNPDLLCQLIVYRDQLNNEDRIKTAVSYTSTYNKIDTYIKRKKLPFTEVTPEFLKKFEQSLIAEGLSKSSISIYTRNIRTIFNRAISNKIVSAEIYPFGKNRYSPPATKKTKKALPIEDIKKIYEYQPVNDSECWARDMWLFSYCGNGINVKDIALLKYQNIVDGEIHLVRAKTKNSIMNEEKIIQIILTEDLKRIINKWGSKNSSPNNYIFDITSSGSDAKQEYRDINQAIKTINKYMKRIAGDLKLERVPTTNFARHSFSTILKRAGVSIEMISEQLGHSNIKTTEIYLSSFEKEQRKEIPNLLLAFKNKPPKRLPAKKLLKAS